VRIRNWRYLSFAGVFALVGALHLIKGKDADLGIVFLAIAAGHLFVAFFVAPRVNEAAEELGPGSLRATPARRFRASGWPPSKRPDDYR
jgi:hypothetical protein